MLNKPLLKFRILEQWRDICDEGEMTMDMKKAVEASGPSNAITAIKDITWAPKIVDKCVHSRINRRGY